MSGRVNLKRNWWYYFNTPGPLSKAPLGSACFLFPSWRFLVLAGDPPGCGGREPTLCDDFYLSRSLCCFSLSLPLSRASFSVCLTVCLSYSLCHSLALSLSLPRLMELSLALLQWRWFAPPPQGTTPKPMKTTKRTENQ